MSSIDSVINRHLRELLVGRAIESIEDIRDTWDLLYAKSLPYGRKGIPIMALSRVDLALWDLLGQARDEPVYELLGGKRTCAAHPKTKLLFGDLPRVTNRLVAEMKSGPRPAPADPRKSSVERAKQRLQVAAGRASASLDEAPAASSELETGERRRAKTPTPTPSSVSSHARVLVSGETFTL